MSAIIYIVENTVNSKIYVGKTTYSAEQRWKNHVGTARCGSTTYFHRAIRKYGADAFAVRVLETVDDPGVLNDREIHWIATLEPDYNLTTGGEGVPGLKHSDATKQKISDANRGLKRSAEQRQNYSAAKTGVIFSDEHRQNISRAARRRPPMSAETRAKMSASHTGTKHSAETRAKIGASHTGLKRSDAARANMSAAQKEIQKRR